MKKCILVLTIAIFLILSACSSSDTQYYKQEYFSNKEAFIEIKDILIEYYEHNALQGRLSIWVSEENVSIFADGFDGKVNNSDFAVPFVDDDIQKINDFILSSPYECVEIDENFVEFGTSTGARNMYYCRTEEKPEKLSDNHKLFDFGDGWYFSVCTAR